ncbi:LysM domain-containing protein [Mesobacillus persicus]|uniref:LysM domain-containing protein n=1 Tax=Mesobacillus persicus TaxID=930146 RepID=A0A1H7YWX0_9BACI|nr:LysM peptidoglycan-binding domain-containing protein [Mesobacillus persicus]SEM49868.1 LysM domain-containing protein [Mesobacillus persicus]
MKKIWQNNSYTILLIATSLIVSLVFASGLKSGNEDYITITVQSGESLWKIADDFSNNHNLTNHEFVVWVEKENGITGGKIYAGDELIIPIRTQHNDDTPQYASID